LASDVLDRTSDRKKHILVLDDDESIRSYLVKLLFRCGYTAEAAATPKQAIQILRSNKLPFDLIITDIQMPAISGVEFLSTLAKSENPIPAIVLSGMIHPGHIFQLKEANVCSMLVKPVKSSTLIEKIGEALAGSADSSLVNSAGSAR